ncbi:MAG: SDR family NAD(P)-dependent oxidoreductase [Variibacter sp.]
MAQKDTKAPRVVAITGGASGIGWATAEVLLAAGWKVAILDRDEAALEKARAAPASRDMLVAPLDVTDEEAAERMVQRIAGELGGLTGIVNSAGIAADIPTLDTPVALFRKILDVNVVGTFIVGRAAARVMKKSFEATGVGGSIVNVASVSGLRGSKGRSAYGSSKGAVITLTQVMANDLARYGIRVNALAPGPIDTPMVAQVHTAADRELWTSYLPMKRYGTPKEMATVIEFLLDPERSAYVTGEIIAADGGFRGTGLIAEW